MAEEQLELGLRQDKPQDLASYLKAHPERKITLLYKPEGLTVIPTSREWIAYVEPPIGSMCDWHCSSYAELIDAILNNKD